MREARVRFLIGDKNWDKFERWMRGQTFGRYPDGEADYYDCDVNAFRRKIQTGYDRQGDPIAWD